MPAFGLPAFVLPNIPIGKVVQIVYGTTNTQTTSSSSAYADTNLRATITPTSTNNKVLVFVTQAGCGKTTNSTSLRLQLFRNAEVVAQIEAGAAFTGTVTDNYIGACAMNYLDTPATNTAVTYTTQFASASNTASVLVQISQASSSIVLMEVTP